MAEAEEIPRSESPVEVDVARALQIIGLNEEADGDDTLFKFELKESNLVGILEKVPKDMKVAVVSVVGNFRTGKSFLLTFMLRYLRNRHASGLDWQTEDGECLTEGNANADGSSTGHESFEWRGGHERMTTGLWMYSEPFIHTAASGEKVAVLVVDTQGLFDNEASMVLTSCIFGLSTLMSSHQIYNVKERISEDHLQNLALFSEYGRMALAEDGAEDEVGDEGADEGAEGGAAAAASEGKRKRAGTGVAASGKAFQRLEFLVRDWPELELLDEDFMNSYIRKTVLEDKAEKSLRETRESITACFENISCFMLPHPGLCVTRKNYDGAISGGKGLEPEFRDSLDKYMRRVFGMHLEPKRIHGRQLTAPELLTYIKTYVALFQDGRKFPEAKTVLQATAEANTRNAATLALKKYGEEMDRVCGATVSRFVAAGEWPHDAASSGALELFDQMANMGPKGSIAAVRAELSAAVAAQHAKYAAMNEGRDPMKGVRAYLVPLSVALLSWLVSKLVGGLCGASICDNTADLFGHIYVACVALMVIASAGNIGAFVDHVKHVAPLILGTAQKQKAA